LLLTKNKQLHISTAVQYFENKKKTEFLLKYVNTYF